MLSHLIQWIIISVVLISLLHYFFSFLKTNLTVPKVKDMINMPTKRYKEIIDSIDNKKQIDTASSKMKDELKSYMASLINTKKDNNIKSDNLIKSDKNNFESNVSNSSLDYSFSSY